MNTEIIDLINRNHGDSFDECSENILMYKNTELVCSLNVYRLVINDMSNHAGHGRFVEYSHGVKAKLSNVGPDAKDNTVKTGDRCVYKNYGAVVIGDHPEHPVLIIDSDEYGLQSVMIGELTPLQTELDIAKEKQRKSVVQDIHSALFDVNDDIANQLAKMLQERGHLAEIVLPLESNNDKA